MSFIDLKGCARWTAADIAARVKLLTDVGGLTVGEAAQLGLQASVDMQRLSEALDIEELQALVSAFKQPEAPVVEVTELSPLALSFKASLKPATAPTQTPAEVLLMKLSTASPEVLELLKSRQPVVVSRTVIGE